MAQDPLYEALGTGPDGAGSARPARLRRWLTVLVLVVLVGGLASLVFRHPHSSGDPGVAVARIEMAPAPPRPAPPPAAPPPVAPPGNGDTVEIEHGVKIIRLGQATSPASVRLAVPDAVGAKLTPAPDPRLVETSKFGPLPRIGADGARPADVYARPSDGAAGVPRIALVVGSMGLDQLQTAQAGQRLPKTVTFAFPPDAPDLAAQVAEQRAEGHEAILQLPAGVVGADSASLEPLDRAMASFSGYAGVTIPTGPGVEAVTRDILRRGLYAIGGIPPADASTGAAVRGADVVIGPDADAGAVATALAHLAETARAKGTAVGLIVRAGPNMPAVAAFTDGLEGQGLRLVPASALVDQTSGVVKQK